MALRGVGSQGQIELAQAPAAPMLTQQIGKLHTTFVVAGYDGRRGVARRRQAEVVDSRGTRRQGCELDA